ncbi:MAG TPA: Si-specific NAD(P)(+) transhydrogenase [Dehalococcoidia bacterium]|nr:Si-specific NAD(P)(+) transhydrogenase [Dehalococcoidia bacterium]
MGTHKYDLIVLGSGPAGEKGAAQAAYFGKKVALAERDGYLGGAAASTAIPSKTLRETSLALSGLRARHLHGVDLSLRREVTIKDFLHHERMVKDAEHSRVANNMLRHGIDVFKGTGSFCDKRTIKVEAHDKAPQFLEGDIILIATGSSPRRPDTFPKDQRIYDSDTILQLKAMPKNMVVVGGGVIGCEYGCIFAALDVDVSLIHNHEVLLPFLDRDISLTLQKSMSKMGIDLLMPETVESCTVQPEGLALTLGSGKVIKTDTVITATGRTSNTGALNLEAAGITPGEHGLLAVNENYQVVHPETRKPVPGIYAAGDVIGAPALASTSMEQARFAMIKAFQLEPYKEYVAPILPRTVYTIPECSGAGQTEEECLKEHIDYVVGQASYSQNARGMIVGDDDGFLKLIFEFNSDLSRPMRLLGVHVIGEIASELVHIGVNALMTGAASDLFIDTCFNYPTLGELYKYATYDAMGRRAKRLGAT